jgi:hypothetical protein
LAISPFYLSVMLFNQSGVFSLTSDTSAAMRYDAGRGG